MRWYLTEAPSAHFAQTHQPPNLKQQRHDATAESLVESQEALSGHQEGCVVSQEGAVLHDSQHHYDINKKWVSLSTGTWLRVLLSSSLLCVYFVLLGIGY